jgi:protein tyrosine/serine phosphatase
MGAVEVERRLEWDGCRNVRDLGGLRTAGGRVVRRGAVVRADGLDRLAAAGWDALLAHGVRTVVDLRNDDEIGRDAAPRPVEVETVRLPLDGVHDREFWDVWSVTPAFGTPAYYAPWLARFPERAVTAVRAVAHAAPGGVVVHCGLGRDRAGLVTLLLLTLLGVPADVIAADHALSGEDDDEAVAWYAAEGTSREASVEAAVLAAAVALAGLGSDDLGALRARML